MENRLTKSKQGKGGKGSRAWRKEGCAEGRGENGMGEGEGKGLRGTKKRIKRGNLRGGEKRTWEGMGMGWRPSREEGAAKGERVEGRNESEGKMHRGRGGKALIVCGRNAQGLARAPGDSWP